MILRLCSILLSALISFTGFNSFANPAESSSKAMLAKFAEFQKSFQSFESGCQLPEKGECSFENLCNSVRPNRNNPYLYQNSDGETFPNFAMTMTADLFVKCFDSKASEKFTASKEDPFLFPEILGNQKNQKAKEQYQKASGKVRDIFAEAKKDLIGLLKTKRHEKNKNEIDNVLQRVQQVELNLLNKFSTKDLALEGCAVPNVMYLPQGEKGSSITICPHLMNVPKATLYAIFAHELTHSFDPCAISHQGIQKSVGGRKTYELRDPRQDFEKTSEQSVHAGIPPSKNPFAAMIECLQSDESTGVRIPTYEQELSSLEERFSKRESRLSAQEREVDEELPELGRKMRDLEDFRFHVGYCDPEEVPGLNPRAALKESFSDAVTAALLAEKANKMDPVTAKKWLFETQLPMLQNHCAGFSQGQKEVLVNSMKKKKCETAVVEHQIGFNVEALTHLPDSDRVEKISLAPKEIQNVLECQPKEPKKACF